MRWACDGDSAGALAVQILWLACAHAGLGRGEEALQEAHGALTHMSDLAMRTAALADVAEIAAAAERRDEAVGALAEVLDAPGGTVTAASLRSTPGFSRLRGYPPFEALLSARAAGR